MFACFAAMTAARSRGFELVSGRPVRAAVVSSRMILVKTLARFLSCAPFRYMMFLNWECPAIGDRSSQRSAAGTIPSDEEIAVVRRGGCRRPEIALIAGQYGSIAAFAAALSQPTVAARHRTRSR